MNVSALRLDSNPFLFSTPSDDAKEILIRIKGLNSRCGFKGNAVLTDKLASMKPIELSQILHKVFQEIAKDGAQNDPVKLLNRLADLIPLNKLQEAVNVKDALEDAKSMFKEAQIYLNAKQESISPALLVRASAILDKVISAIDNIITAFGIGDFFKPAESEVQANFKSQKVMMLLGTFSMISTVLLPLLGAASGGLIVGGTILTIAAVSLIWPSIKPMPSYLPGNAECWSKEIKQGAFIPDGRKQSLDKIGRILDSNRHPILIGPSRTGKTLTAKAFAKTVQDKYRVFYLNMGDLVDRQASFLGGGNNILNEISDAMGRHRGKILLILDEIHMACKDKAKIGDRLKTFLDECGAFPHVIGITTDEEYEKYIKGNKALALRFEEVRIENTDADETKKILSDTVLKNRSQPIIDGNIFDRIYNQSCRRDRNAPQPFDSINILKACINLTEKTQPVPADVKITDISNKITSLQSQFAASRSSGIDPSKRKLIADLKAQKKELKELRKKQQTEMHKLSQTKELFDKITKDLYHAVIKIHFAGQKALSSSNEKQLKTFLLLNKLFVPALENTIKQKSKDLGVKMIIDDKLIDHVGAASV